MPGEGQTKMERVVDALLSNPGIEVVHSVDNMITDIPKRWSEPVRTLDVYTLPAGEKASQELEYGISGLNYLLTLSTGASGVFRSEFHPFEDLGRNEDLRQKENLGRKISPGKAVFDENYGVGRISVVLQPDNLAPVRNLGDMSPVWQTTVKARQRTVVRLLPDIFQLREALEDRSIDIDLPLDRVHRISSAHRLGATVLGRPIGSQELEI